MCHNVGALNKTSFCRIFLYTKRAVSEGSVAAAVRRSGEEQGVCRENVWAQNVAWSFVYKVILEVI